MHCLMACLVSGNDGSDMAIEQQMMISFVWSHRTDLMNNYYQFIVMFKKCKSD